MHKFFINRTSPYLLIFVMSFFTGCQQQENKKDKAMISASLRVETDTQLKINQEALLRGSTDEIRVDAATVLLFGENLRARQFLIETLKQTENKPAKKAVCNALIAVREARREIRNKKDFVEPLAELLKNEDISVAKYASEAMLLYDYDEIRGILEPMAVSAGMPAKARTNAIFTMKMQMDIRAIVRIAELTGDKDKQVADTAAETLVSLGIPVSKDSRKQAEVLKELQTRGMERFQRDCFARQESNISELEKEKDQWRKLYLSSLDRIYDVISDDLQRGKFLIEQLNNYEPTIRLWALNKVSQWRIGMQSKLPSELGPILVKLISSDNRDVRLATAKLLSLTGELGLPEKIAEQFSSEQDEEVKRELFVALGAACHYALVPTSGLQLSVELRKQTLGWAAIYLNDDDAKIAHRGAEVIRKLIEPGGLSEDDAAKYMDLLVERYEKDKINNNSALRGDLLGTMARLCGQSAYKPESARRFAAIFEESLADESDIVREAAVDGVICVDKYRALKILTKDFINDKSQIVRDRILELAGEIGSKDDLPWLWEKISSKSDSKPSWQAMMKIFNNHDVNVIDYWMVKFDTQAGPSKISDEQWLSFFELAERKSASENRIAIAKETRTKLAQLYIKSGQYEQAAEYLGKLRESAGNKEQKDKILGQLIDVYLRWPKIDAASRIVGNCLLEKDLDVDSTVIRSIETYLDNPNGGAEPNIIIRALIKIKTEDLRPLWHQQLARWIKRFGIIEDTNTSI